MEKLKETLDEAVELQKKLNDVLWDLTEYLRPHLGFVLQTVKHSYLEKSESSKRLLELECERMALSAIVTKVSAHGAVTFVYKDNDWQFDHTLSPEFVTDPEEWKRREVERREASIAHLKESEEQRERVEYERLKKKFENDE